MSKPPIGTNVEYVSHAGAFAATVTGPGTNPDDDSIACRVIVPGGGDFDAEWVPTMAGANNLSAYWQDVGAGLGLGG